MKINWNFLGELGGGGAKQKTSCGGSTDSFWKCTLTFQHLLSFISLGCCSRLLLTFSIQTERKKVKNNLHLQL